MAEIDTSAEAVASYLQVIHDGQADETGLDVGAIIEALSAKLAEVEREACAKIADKRAESASHNCVHLSYDDDTGTLECNLSHRGDCLCLERQEEAESIAAAIRTRKE